MKRRRKHRRRSLGIVIQPPVIAPMYIGGWSGQVGTGIRPQTGGNRFGGRPGLCPPGQRGGRW